MSGKTAIVTGAGGGIGEAIARIFACAGASLILNDVNRAAVEDVATSIRNTGTPVDLVLGDASRESVAMRLTQQAMKHFGSLHILVNNAGIAGSSVGDGPVTSSKVESWDLVMRVNLRSVFLCSRYAVPIMIRGRKGSVINMSSVLAIAASAEHFTSHAYAASKGAILSLTRTMAAHYADRGIRVNALCPGLVATPMTARAKTNKELMRYVAAKQRLLHGFGTAEGVADAALFLASDESRSITGTVLPVDGGWTAGT